MANPTANYFEIAPLTQGHNTKRTVPFCFFRRIFHRAAILQASQHPTDEKIPGSGKALHAFTYPCTLFSFTPVSNQCRVRLQKLHTDNMTGTSTRTPTTVASVAPDCSPNREIDTATANSKKLLAPISAPGAAMLCGTLKYLARP